jgi:hypothetical protein
MELTGAQRGIIGPPPSFFVERYQGPCPGGIRSSLTRKTFKNWSATISGMIHLRFVRKGVKGCADRCRGRALERPRPARRPDDLEPEHMDI